MSNLLFAYLAVAANVALFLLLFHPRVDETATGTCRQCKRALPRRTFPWDDKYRPCPCCLGMCNVCGHSRELSTFEDKYRACDYCRDRRGNEAKGDGTQL
jgi:hypothetical protein